MRARLGVRLAGAGLLLAGGPVFAHHAFSAEYDSKKPVEFDGVVTKVEWTNPHAHFYVDVKGAGGTVANWNMELASPNMLVRNGWKRTSLKPGDEVHVTGSQAKDGTNTASAAVITLTDGRRLTFLSASDDGKGK